MAGAYHRSKTGYLNPQMASYAESEKFYNRMKAEQREAMIKASESIPDDAFADDVITNDEYGSIKRHQTIVETTLWHYD